MKIHMVLVVITNTSHRLKTLAGPL